MENTGIDYEKMRLLVDLVNASYTHVDLTRDKKGQLKIERVTRLSVLLEDEIIDIKKLIIKEINKTIEAPTEKIGATRIKEALHIEEDTKEEEKNGTTENKEEASSN